MSTLAGDGDDSETFELGLQGLREEQGTLEQARALEERLLQRLGPEALSAPVTMIATRRAFGAWPAKSTAALCGVVALLGLGVYLTAGARSERDDARARAVASAVAPRAPQPPPAASVPAPAAAAHEPDAVAPVEAIEPRRKPAGAEAPRTDELTLMQRARAALRDDPKGALRIAEQHAREYPAGVFVQEREVLAINALLKQRRSAEALGRAERFVAAHEGSPYAVQLRALLANKPRTSSELQAPVGPRP